MFAGAAFTDAADINPDNLDAVELLSALKIIQGREDGSYDPQGNVTRAEMAKMIYVIRNGGNDDASAYETVTTTFTDISGHWAEGYIKYLQNTNIVAGKSATKFDPNGNVTTVEAMKMALVLSGYRADKANLTGANWANNTISQATTVGMTKDVNSAMAGACTRQDAAQILYNTLLDVYAVQFSEITNSFLYDSKTGLAFNGQPISVGYKWMDLRVESGYLTAVPSAKVNAKGVTFTYDANGDGTYGDTVAFRNVTTDYSDLMGFEVKVVWDDDHKDSANAIYGIYKTADNISYTMNWKDVEQDGAKIKFNSKSYDLEGAAFNNLFTVYADTSWNTPATNWTAANFNGDALADNVVLIDADGDGKIDAAQVKTEAVTKIGYIGSKTITTETLVGNQDFYGIAYDTTPDAEDVTLDSNLAAGDYAVVTYDVYTDKLVYTKAEMQNGTVDGTRTEGKTKQILVNGTWYKCTEGYEFPTTLVTKDTIEFITVDDMLYYVKKTDGQWGSKSLAVVYQAADYNVGVDADEVEARLLTRDGKKLKGIVSELNGAAVANTAAVQNIIGQVVTYRVNSNNEYELRTITSNYIGGFDEAYHYNNNNQLEKVGTAVQGNNSGLTTAAIVNGDNMAGAELADDAIIFVLEKNLDNNNGGGTNNYVATENADDAKVFTGKQIKNLSATAKTDLKADKAFTFLRVEDNGYTYTAAGSVLVDAMPKNISGSTYGYLTADAYESYVDADGFRLYTMWTSQGEIQAREKNGDEFTYEAGTVLNFNVKSIGENGVWEIEDVNVPVLTTDNVTSDNNGKTAGSTVGISNTKYNVTSDTVVLFVDSEAKKGEDFEKGIIMKGNTALGSKNIRYLATSGNDLDVLIVDTNNDMKSAPAVVLKTADVTDAVLVTALNTFGKVTVDGDYNVTNLVVPADRALHIDGDLTVTTSLTANGTLTANKVTANNSVTINGAATINDAVTTPANITVGATGALTLNGGAAVQATVDGIVATVGAKMTVNKAIASGLTTVYTSVGSLTSPGVSVAGTTTITVAQGATLTGATVYTDTSATTGIHWLVG